MGGVKESNNTNFIKMKKREKSINAGKPATKSNLVKELTVEVVNERHNALARYIGIPCVVDADAVIEACAPSTEGRMKETELYACYRVNLQPFKGDFNKVSFRAVTDGDDVAFGCIIDKNGNVECVAQAGEPATSTVSLPLTGNSKYLFAAMPAYKGKPQWKNVKVELYNDGLITEIDGALKKLQARIYHLERRLEAVISGSIGC